MIYSEKLKNIRELKALKQSDLSSLLKIDQSVYSHYETEYNIMPLKHLISIADYFDVSLDYLFNLNNEMKYENAKKDYNLDLQSKRLKEFRKENKLTQTKLAEQLSTSCSVISGYELRRCPIATPFLYTICKKYKISADYLLGRIDEPKYIN